VSHGFLLADWIAKQRRLYRRVTSYLIVFQPWTVLTLTFSLTPPRETRETPFVGAFRYKERWSVSEGGNQLLH
jgi:hypothetical protein